MMKSPLNSKEIDLIASTSLEHEGEIPLDDSTTIESSLLPEDATEPFSTDDVGHQQISPLTDIPYSPPSITRHRGCFDRVVRGRKSMVQQGKLSRREPSSGQAWSSRIEFLRTCSPTLLNDEEFELGFYSERFMDDPWKVLTSTSSLQTTSSSMHSQSPGEKEGEIKLDS
jgi:hypothetical protein